MQGHSGMSRIDEQILKIEDEEVRKMHELLTKEHEAMFKLAELSMALDGIKKDAIESRKLRDQYCLMLEKKYGIRQGTRWDFDEKRGGLVVHPLKPIVRDIIRHDNPEKSG